LWQQEQQQQQEQQRQQQQFIFFTEEGGREGGLERRRKLKEGEIEKKLPTCVEQPKTQRLELDDDEDDDRNNNKDLKSIKEIRKGCGFVCVYVCGWLALVAGTAAEQKEKRGEAGGACSYTLH